VKFGEPARRLRPALPPGWSSLRAGVGPVVRPVCLCLVQKAKAKDVLELPLETSSRPVVLRPVCPALVRKAQVKRPLVLRPVVSLLRPEARDPVCLLDQVKLVALHPRPERVDSRQLLTAGSRLLAQQRLSAEGRSWDSQS
jgi:hypothetical protein